MLRGLPGLLLLLLLVAVRLLARLVTGLLHPSMVHFTVQHRSDTLPPDHAWILLVNWFNLESNPLFQKKYNRGADVNVNV